MADVGLVVRKLGLGNRKHSSRVETRAYEFLRRCVVKLGHNALGQAEVAKPAICVELACLVLQVPLDTQVLVRCSGTTQKQYKKAKSVIMKALGVRQSISHRDICIQFGCLKLDSIVKQTLEEYKNRIEEENSAESGLKVDVRLPKYVGAAFCLVAKAYKVKVDKSRLLDTLGIQLKELNMTVCDMFERMKDVFGDEEEVQGEGIEATEGDSDSGNSELTAEEEREALLRRAVANDS